MLKKNTGYQQSDRFLQLQSDVQRFLDSQQPAAQQPAAQPSAGSPQPCA